MSDYNHPKFVGSLRIGNDVATSDYSNNGGSSWTHLIAGMEPNDSIWSIVINPVNPVVVYAGSFHSGVYQWNSVENLWTHINDGLSGGFA